MDSIKFANMVNMPLEIRSTSFYYSKSCNKIKKVIEKDEKIILKLDADSKELYKTSGDNVAFLSMSSFEGFGRCYIEAQINGLVVIARPNNITDYVLCESALILHKGMDILEIQDALSSGNKLKEFQRKGYENARRFSFENFSECWERIIKNVDDS
jgi:hypothetical protein